MKLDETPIQPIECLGVRCTANALMEVEGNRVMVSIAKKDVQRVTLRHGVQAPNPALQIIFGVALMSTAYFPVRHLIHWISQGGVLFVAEGLLIIVAVLGVWTAFEALKRGYFLEVQTPQGNKRLAFTKRPDSNAVNELIAFIERHYEIPVLREDGTMQ